MAKPGEREVTIRTRWSRFLAPLLADVSIAKLADALSDLTGVLGDVRGELYAYRNGTQTPRAARVFCIGEALQILGANWCSGPVALYASGRFDAFAHTIANLAALHDSRDLALWIATLGPLAQHDDPHGVAARTALAEYPGAEHRERLRWAFDRSSTRGAPEILLAVEQLARSDAPLYMIEPAVRSALRSWAIASADDDLHRLVLRDVIEFEIDQLRAQLESPSDSIARQILAPNNGKPTRRKKR